MEGEAGNEERLHENLRRGERGKAHPHLEDCTGLAMTAAGAGGGGAVSGGKNVKEGTAWGQEETQNLGKKGGTNM